MTCNDIADDPILSELPECPVCGAKMIDNHMVHASVQ